MKNKLKGLAVRVLKPFSAYPTHATDAAAMEDFIRRMRPFRTSHDLIRLGPDRDGGYLVPDDLEGISALFSPGVEAKSEFERECADQGMKVFMADKSVDSPAISHELFHFTKKHLGAYTDTETMTLDGWFEGAGSPTGDLMLQMDIEGAEYEVLLSISEALLGRFRIVVIEMHNLHWLWSKPYFDLASKAIDKVLKSHLCVHIHPNNWNGIHRYRGLEIPRVAEFTFLRRDGVVDTQPARQFPHPLDRPNGPGPELALPECWYRD
jgi:hypothetical protein